MFKRDLRAHGSIRIVTKLWGSRVTDGELRVCAYGWRRETTRHSSAVSQGLLTRSNERSDKYDQSGEMFVRLLHRPRLLFLQSVGRRPTVEMSRHETETLTRRTE